jgi:transposase
VPYRNYRRSQDWLLPPSLGELIAEDDPVRFVAEIMDTADLGGLGIVDVAQVEGAPAYHPRLLLGLWVYGFMRRERSSRQIERACRENITYMWLAGLQRPDHVTLARFYRRNREAMRRLFKETVRLAVGVGLVDFALQAIDGSRIASARRGSLQSEAQLAGLLAEVEVEVAALEQAEQQAEAGAGDEPPPDGRPVGGRKVVRERLQQALAKVRSGRQGAESQTPVSQDQAGDAQEGLAAAEPDQPSAEAQEGQAQAKLASSTDPDAVLMKKGATYVVGYNAQLAVDNYCGVIVGAEVVANASDGNLLLPMLRSAEATAGRLPQQLVADTGYFSSAAVEGSQAAGIDTFVPERPPSNQRDGPQRSPYHLGNFRYDAGSDCYICPLGRRLPFIGTSHNQGAPIRCYRCFQVRDCPAGQDHSCT